MRYPGLRDLEQWVGVAERSARWYGVKLTVKAYKDGRKVLHALEAEEMKNAPPGTLPPYSGTEVLQADQPTTGRTLRIADLLRGAAPALGLE